MDAIFHMMTCWLFCQKYQGYASDDSLVLVLGLVLVSGRRKCLWGMLDAFECMVEPRDTWNICGGPKLQHEG